MKKNNKKIFGQGICFPKLFWIFVIASIFGALYEPILNFITHYIKDGSIFIEARRGVFYGPFSPIYGMGAVLMTVFLIPHQNKKWYSIWLIASLYGGIFEYAISFLQETFVGTVSWDYSQHILNIHGRTTLPFMMIWGFLGLFFIKYCYPFLSDKIEKIPYQKGTIVTTIMVILLGIDMLLSWTALFRQMARKQGKEAMTVVGKIYDEIYTDEYIQKHFPNMKVRD